MIPCLPNPTGAPPLFSQITLTCKSPRLDPRFIGIRPSILVAIVTTTLAVCYFAAISENTNELAVRDYQVFTERLGIEAID